MSQGNNMQEDEALPPVLSASVHDVRYFAALLRGVSFSNRATVLVTENGLIVSVEEARTLVGTAYIFKDIFDEYAFHPEPPAPPRPRGQPPRANRSKVKKKRKGKGKAKAKDQSASETESETESSSDEDNQLKDKDWEEVDEDGERRTRARMNDDGDSAPQSAAFEIPLNTVLECVNIFGTVGASATTVSSGGAGGSGGGRDGGVGRGQGRGWRRDRDREEHNDSDAEQAGGREGRGIDAYFTGASSEKRTGMRLSYAGSGYPLTMIIAEDASGPTTTCEITTFDPEPQFELDFDSSSTVLKIILKSSWLRDALSELDPSCDKLTFVGNPPTAQENQTVAGNSRQKQQQRRVPPPRPMLRIQATGTFGSTEMDYPNDRDVLETFECVQTVSFSYRFAHISRTLRALQSSTKTSLRIDENGLLSLQFLMPTPRPRSMGGTTDAFVELRCSALEEDF